MTRTRRPAGVLSAAVAATVVLAACSSSGPAKTAGTGAHTQAAGSGSAAASCSGAHKKLNLAFVYTTTSLNPFQEMALGAKAAAQEDGNVNLTEVAPPTTDGPKEVQQFESVMHTATDGIAMETVTPNLFVRPLNQATSANVPLVAVDTPAPPGTKVPLFVGNSNFDIGAALGNAFVGQHPDPNGEVVLGIDIPALSVLQDRMKGLQSVIKAKLPQMKIVGPLNSQNSPTDTYNAWNSFVGAYPKAVGFIGVGGVDGVALPEIKQKTGKKFLAGSADVPPAALQNVKNGSLFALSSPEHWMKGYIAIHELIQHDRTCKPMPSGWWNTGNLLITKANVDSILARQKDNSTRLAWFKQHDIPQQLASPPIKPMSEAN